MTDFTPDLSNIDIMFAAACGRGSYTYNFHRSSHRTVTEVERYGGKVTFAEVLFGADVALVRERLFGIFCRSNHTHMLMVDDDMGWDERDVVRMALWAQQGKDFIGAAGPKKMYPIQFAANKTDENGVKQMVELTPETGICEVNEVGMAFVLISRACAQKMVEAYPQLAYYGDADCKELNYALFDPMLVPEGGHQRRYSEDYAFCRRWRDIGGKVELLADVRLEHTGTHTFAGSFVDMFTKQGPCAPVGYNG